MYGPPSEKYSPRAIPLTRHSHWFEVVWGLPDCAWAAWFCAGSFHPSHQDMTQSFREGHPQLAVWLDRELRGPWSFVHRDAMYCDDTQSVYHEHLLLFESRDEGTKFVEAHAHAVLQARLTVEPTPSDMTRKAHTAAALQARRLLELAPAALVPVLLRHTPPLLSNRRQWSQTGEHKWGHSGSMWFTLISYKEDA